MSRLSLSELEWDRPASIILIAMRQVGSDRQKIAEWLKKFAEKRGKEDSLGRIALMLSEDEKRLERILSRILDGMLPRSEVLMKIEQNINSFSRT